MKKFSRIIALVLLYCAGSVEFSQIGNSQNIRRLQQYSLLALDTSYTYSDEIQEVENATILAPDDEIYKFEIQEILLPDAEIDEVKSQYDLQSNDEEIEQQQDYYAANVAPKSDIQVLYIIQENEMQYLTKPKIESLIEYEVLPIDFAAIFGISFCKSINTPCQFWERRQRYTWNSETQQCEPNFLCENEGFETEEDCIQQALVLCT